MTSRYTLFGKVAASICVFFILKWLISYVALSSIAKVNIDAEFDHADVIDIYFSSGMSGSGFKQDLSKRSTTYNKDQRSSRTVYLNNHVARKLRIDTGIEPGSVRLYGITLISHYGDAIVFDHEEIYRSFRPNEVIDTFSLEDDHVLISSESNDAFINYDGEIILDNPFVGTILPMILGLLCFIFLSTQTLRNYPAFTDINSKVSSSGVNFGSLDGIRGLAALLVLAEHTTATLKGSGTFGVWLFFCLSGFLLTIPFVRQPDRALSPQYMGRYITRRVKRIVPMYYVMITITILFMGKFDVAIRHYLFLQADGHYWTVAQEMFFYLILPFIMVLNALFFRKKAWLSIVFLAVTAYLCNRYITIHVVPLYGNNVTLRPMVGIFLLGVCMAFIYGWLSNARSESLLRQQHVSPIASTAGLVLLVISILVSVHTFSSIRFFDAWTRPGWFGLAAGLVVLCTVLSERSLLSRIMNFLPLRAVGLVGFSFYLVHPMMISCIRGTSLYFTDYEPAGTVLFIITGIVSYILSTITYTYIERPFIKGHQSPTQGEPSLEASRKQSDIVN